ncbi:MAG: phytoene/squalene synthase family protein [Methyloceanibacter sp.]
MDEAERRHLVRRIARAGDPDRSLAALFAPPDARDDLFALYAFNVELARIAEQVSEPDLGAIRLQWWREAIGWSDKLTGNPVADAFAETRHRRALSPSRVDALIDARQFDIAEKIMPDWPSLEAYLGDTAGSLFALAAEIMGAQGEGVDQACDAAGRAYGLTGLMRSLPVHAVKGRIDLPADALHRHGASPERLLAGETDEGLRSLLEELRGRARENLAEAMRHLSKFEASARLAFQPLCLVEPYLAALAKIRDPLQQIAEINPLYRLWRMTRWR